MTRARRVRWKSNDEYLGLALPSIYREIQETEREIRKASYLAFGTGQETNRTERLGMGQVSDTAQSIPNRRFWFFASYFTELRHLL
jgi:hypothetical protein